MAKASKPSGNRKKTTTGKPVGKSGKTTSGKTGAGTKRTTGGRSRTQTGSEKTGGRSRADSGTSRLVSEFAEQIAGSALQFAARSSKVPMRMAKAFLLSPEKRSKLKPDQLKMMYETGQYLRDVREVAGLTVSELGEAVDLGDKSVLEAAENGTATLSFELILRLASLLARHDPLPFVIRLARTYNPDAWRVLDNWGIGRLPLQLERERQFINIYRSKDEARKLSDDGYAEVLKFTRSAFDMALHFVATRDAADKEPQDPSD